MLSRTASSGDMLQVLACANHVALYDFDRVQHRWVRKFLDITRPLAVSCRSRDQSCGSVLPKLAWKGSYLQVRKDVEGSFFLIQRSALPVHQLIILNKKNAGAVYADLGKRAASHRLFKKSYHQGSHALIYLKHHVFTAENYVEDLLPDLGFELTLPYIMYRNKADEVLSCPECPASSSYLASIAPNTA